MKRYDFLAIFGTACVVIGFSSYRIGHDRSMAQAAADAAQSKKTAEAAPTPEEPVSSRPPEELISLKQKLRQSYATCPSAENDWILRGQTAAVLATMTTTELKELLEEIVNTKGGGFIQRIPEADCVLAADILREWGRRDPIAACTAVSNAAIGPEARIAAFKDWLLRDPRAVERWMKSDGDTVPVYLRTLWVSERVKVDPYDAVQQLSKLTPEQREKSLLEWSTASALLPAPRMALLDVVKEDPDLMRKCAGRMAAILADNSVEEAYQFVDSLKLDEKSSMWLDDSIFEKWANRHPQEAFAAWAAQKQDRLPESFLNALDNWSTNSPGAEEAIQWMDTVQAGPVKEQIEIDFIENLASGERFEQAVRMGMSMENREEGNRQVLRVVTMWKEKFPAHAKERLAVISREKGVEGR